MVEADPQQRNSKLSRQDAPANLVLLVTYPALNSLGGLGLPQECP